MTDNKITSRDWETLSAYLDGQLTGKEKARLEARLEDDPRLQRALDALQRTRSLVRSLPRMKAPRNFTLTPEQVGRRQPARERLFSAFRLASAVASLLFVLVVMGDFLGAPGLSARQESLEVQSIAVVTDEAAVEKSAPLEEEGAEAVVETPAGEVVALEMEPQGEALAATVDSFQSQAGGREEQRIAGPEAVGEEAVKAEIAADEAAPSMMLTAPEARSEEAEQPLPESQLSEDKTVAPGGSPAPTVELHDAEMPPQTPVSWPALRILEVALALIAVGTGLVAFFLKRQA